MNTNKTVLLTGAAGFVGCNLVRYMLKEHPNYRIISVDALTYSGNFANLDDVFSNENHIFIKADIRDSKSIQMLFERYGIDTVINLAAESHVDRSIMNPQLFLETNILGTQTLLDVAMANWKKYPDDVRNREYKEGVRYLQVSTDEVYGALGKEGKFTETTCLAPNSPYSASKAGADMIVLAYSATYGLPINITRCSNNYGPYQFPEKLIPLMISNIMMNRRLPVYGDGMQVRDWLHVSDHCSGIDIVLHKGVVGEVYNIGGNNEHTNIDIVKTVLAIIGKPESLIYHASDRPGHDRRYAIDNTKITSTLGWRPTVEFTQGLEDTVRWYMDNTAWVNEIVNGEYRYYYDRMYRE